MEEISVANFVDRNSHVFSEEHCELSIMWPASPGDVYETVYREARDIYHFPQ